MSLPLRRASILWRGILLALIGIVHAQALDLWGRGEVPRLTDPQEVPRTLPALWHGYDAGYDRDNPLEVVVHKTWETREGIVVSWVQLTVGTFQGRKSLVCGYFAHPRDAKNLPAILAINGGPQTASEGSAVSWAGLGYACFNPNHHQDGAMTGAAAGLPNTTWGALNAGANPGPYGPFNPSERTIDAVPSPRNDALFPRQMSARRIITFLVRQPQVDPRRIGVVGFSTGGSLAVYTGLDPRVAALVPQCGGCGGKMDPHDIITGQATALDQALDRSHGALLREFDEGGCWKYLKAPVLLRGATNDFHCPDWNSVQALAQARVDRRYVLAPNTNHTGPREVLVADHLWFEHHLKGAFSFPPAAEGALLLKQPDGIPLFQVTLPRSDLPVKRVEMFFTDGRNPLTRFWVTGTPNRQGDGTWRIPCPVSFADEPLFAFANVIYAIPPVVAPNHLLDGCAELAVSSSHAWAWPADLQAAQVRPQPATSRMIDDFSRGGRDWTLAQMGDSIWWEMTTRKISSPRFLGPKGGELVFAFNSPEAGARIGVQVTRAFLPGYWQENNFYGFFDLPRRGWNTVRVRTGDLANPYGWKLDDWHKLTMLTIRGAEGMRREAERKWLPLARSIAAQMNRDGRNPAYTPSTRALPAQVSGWDESYYTSAGDEFIHGGQPSPDDLFVRVRLRDLRWEGGEDVPRSKPHVEEKFPRPTAPPE